MGQSIKKAGDNNQITQKIENADTEIKDKLKGLVTNVKYTKIEDEYLFGMELSFDAKKGANPKELDDDFTLLPLYNAADKTLSFRFKPSKKEEEKKPAEEPAKSDKDPNANPGQEPSPEKQQEEIMNLILSSARYQIVLSGFNVTKASIKGIDSTNTHNIQVIQVGSQYIIDVPYMSILSKEKKGFDVVVTTK